LIKSNFTTNGALGPITPLFIFLYLTYIMRDRYSQYGSKGWSDRRGGEPRNKKSLPNTCTSKRKQFSLLLSYHIEFYLQRLSSIGLTTRTTLISQEICQYHRPSDPF